MERVIREVQKNEGCEIVKKKKKGRPSKGQNQKGRRPVKSKNHVEEKSNVEGQDMNETKQFLFQIKVQQEEEACKENMTGNVSGSGSESNNGNVTFQEDISYQDPGNAQSYKDRCLHKLEDDVLLTALVNVLYASNFLHDFMLLVKQLADKTLPVMNIAFLLNLERSRWQSLTSTTGMRFRDVTKKFWCVVYRFLKGKAFCFFSESKNWGHVISKISGRGRLDPKKSNVNFAVPNGRYLRNINNVMGRIIPPGKIEESFNLLKGKKMSY